MINKTDQLKTTNANYFITADPSHQRKEKEKARILRKSSWWKQQIGHGVCYYCKQKFKSVDLTMDHLVPIIRGGKTTKNNAVVSCKPCNNKKKYYLPVEMAMAQINSDL